MNKPYDPKLEEIKKVTDFLDLLRITHIDAVGNLDRLGALKQQFAQLYSMKGGVAQLKPIAAITLESNLTAEDLIKIKLLFKSADLHDYNIKTTFAEFARSVKKEFWRSAKSASLWNTTTKETTTDEKQNAKKPSPQKT